MLKGTLPPTHRSEHLSVKIVFDFFPGLTFLSPDELSAITFGVKRSWQILRTRHRLISLSRFPVQFYLRISTAAFLKKGPAADL